MFAAPKAFVCLLCIASETAAGCGFGHDAFLLAKCLLLLGSFSVLLAILSVLCLPASASLPCGCLQNPEGVMGIPDPPKSVPHIRGTFGRMVSSATVVQYCSVCSCRLQGIPVTVQQRVEVAMWYVRHA